MLIVYICHTARRGQRTEGRILALQKTHRKTLACSLCYVLWDYLFHETLITFLKCSALHILKKKEQGLRKESSNQEAFFDINVSNNSAWKSEIFIHWEHTSSSDLQYFGCQFCTSLLGKIQQMVLLLLLHFPICKPGTGTLSVKNFVLMEMAGCSRGRLLDKTAFSSTITYALFFLFFGLCILYLAQQKCTF